MPIISDIQQQKNNPNRYSIYVDDKYAFPLSANALLDTGLHRGQELTEEELTATRTKAELMRGYDQALNYIALRKRTNREVGDYLKRKEYGQEAIDQIIEKLMDARLLDDTDFAESFVRDRQLLKPRSKRQLTAELRKKGADRESIEAVLANVSTDDELAALREVINKKLTRYSDQQKLIRYLQGQGFAYSMIKQALNQD
jgi:regulatory protein